jgi:hypothetical protein
VYLAPLVRRYASISDRIDQPPMLLRFFVTAKPGTVMALP